MIRRKAVSILLVITLISTLFPTMMFGASGETEKEHWGISAMQKWVQDGLITGYSDGTLRPDYTITRAEFASILQSLFKYSSTTTLPMKDVEKTAWYANAVNKVLGYGVLNGYPDGTFKPNAALTRQDAAKVIVDAFQLGKNKTNHTDAIAGFKDRDQISSYASDAVNTLVKEGVMKGYSNHTLRPQQSITRAEIIALLSLLVDKVIHSEGEYKNEELVNSLIVNTQNVNIDNYVVHNNAYLTSGIGEGDVMIQNSSIKGNLFINGGGSNSIHIQKSTVGNIIIEKKNGMVRVVISAGSVVDELTILFPAILVIAEGATIGKLVITETAKGSDILNEGTIKEIVNDAGEEIKQKPINPEPVIEPSTPVTNTSDRWKLVWSDEFDGSGDNLDPLNGLDLDKWGYQHGTGSEHGLVGWGNNELQYYRPNNVVVEDGMLKITAKKEEHEGMSYTSGRIYTEPTFSKTYGKFEAKIKLPAGAGLWPAFWMMPQDSEYGTWASSGEIDIMEAKGRLLNRVGGAIHFGKNWPNNKQTAEDYIFPAGQSITDFHVYGLEWEPGELRWYVDGNLFQKINNWDSWGADQPAKYAFPAPFDKPFHMILNLAIGGNFDGGIIPKDSDLPAQMLVDYVRVYDLANRPYRTVTEPKVDVEPISSPYKQAIAGNYVYDHDYKQPFSTISTDTDVMNEQYWNLVHLPQFNGVGAISVDSSGQSPFAKIDITAPGGEAHSIQLIQNVTVGKGRWYKLSFDAKSNGNRNMNVKIGGGDSRGWSVYSDQISAQLTDQVKNYEMSFLMAAETDKLARLEFNVGGNNLPVWIGNVKLVEIEAIDPFNEEGDKEPLNNGNHVYNGSFDLGYIHRLTYWNLLQQNAVAKTSVDPAARELFVKITSPGERPEAITLTQKGISLIPDNEYELTFKARATKDRSISVDLLSQNGTSYELTQSVDLTTGMQAHTVKFNVAGVVESSGQLAFLFGGETGDVYIDDIVLLRLTDNNIGDLPLELQFPLVNGDFSNGMTAWRAHIQEAYESENVETELKIVDEVAVFDIRNIGTESWHVMLLQDDLQLKRKEIYTLELDMKSTVNRPVDIVVENAEYVKFLSEKADVTTDWKTYSYEFEMEGDAIASFKLLLGKLEADLELEAHFVSIDNVRLEKKNARKEAFLVENGYFDQQLAGWNEHVQGLYDSNPSNAIFSANNNVLYAKINHFGVNPWDIVLSQNLVNLKKNKTYIVSFLAAASNEKSIDVVVENSSYTRYLSQKATLSSEVTEYSFEFTMPVNDSSSLKFLFGKQADDVNTSSDVYIDNVRFELKGAREAIGGTVRTDHQILN